MVHKRMHCRAVSKAPQLAQIALTPLNLKLNAAIQMVDTILLTQRQLQWKVFFPPSWEGTTDTTPTVPDIPTF